MPQHNGSRILYLRTFRTAKSDYQLVASLAMTVSGLGRLIMVGPDEDKARLQRHWRKRFGNEADLHQYVEYVACSNEQWRRVINYQISMASCILFHFSPKRNRFPAIRPPKMSQNSFEEFFQAPLQEASSGHGLLHEITYLRRLDKLQSTIVLCTSRNFPYINHLFELAPFIGYTSQMAPLTYGFHFKNTPKGPRALTPRFSAFDKQLVSLLGSYRIVSFSPNQIRDPIRSGFSEKLRSLVLGVIRQEKRRKESRQVVRPHVNVLLGKSNKPRRLPPDNARKIIQFTNVEDLLHIPPDEIADVDVTEILSILDEDEAREGCPSCKAPLSRIFFYVRSLHREANDGVNGRCQLCFARLAVTDGTLHWVI
jgi:hypothetical protein